MALGAVDEKTVAEVVESYASQLEDLARSLRESQRLPAAAWVTVFFKDGEIHRFRKYEPGFNLLHAVGVFECQKRQVVDEIIKG